MYYRRWTITASLSLSLSLSLDVDRSCVCVRFSLSLVCTFSREYVLAVVSRKQERRMELEEMVLCLSCLNDVKHFDFVRCRWRYLVGWAFSFFFFLFSLFFSFRFFLFSFFLGFFGLSWRNWKLERSEFANLVYTR